ncbi:MAG TPA: biopolymer transporter ExbD [bacterium]|nr:biopolymer transporter ExbD [bacterium]HNT64756.1 biopolymer transporter ExbD [bacterium]
MAYQPSKRSSHTPQPVEINMFPMMNLMVVLIPLLLSTATAIQIGIIELNLPQAAGGATAGMQLPKESRQNIDLTVTITSEGIYLSSAQAILHNPVSGGPTIPMNEDGSYNFSRLNEMLVDIKTKIAGGPLDTKRIIMQAEGDIGYQILVSAMDAARSFKIDDIDHELFPEVSISAGIL